MAEHTPGPWINAARSAGAHIHADQGEIAWLRSYMGISDNQIEANARLIAAAPDLLAALNGLINRHSALVSSGDCGFWEVENEAEMMAARAAISKATS